DSAISRYHNLDRQEEIKQWYGGYEAGDGIQLFNPLSNDNLLVPSKEIEIKLQNLQQKRQSSYSVDTLLDMLLKCDIQKFEEYLQNMKIETLSFYFPSNQSENGYHLFMVGLPSQANFGDTKSNLIKKEDSVENNHKHLKDIAKEGLAQILDKKYRTGVPDRSMKLVECGIAFQGKQICI
ncbi:36271_t:CDS:2, partial [Gigaspora margarita]